MAKGKPSKPLADPLWLAAQIDAGRSTVEIATDAGVTDRTVRNAIVRHGLRHPDPRQQTGDLDGAVAAYVAGIGQDRAIAIGGVSDRRLRRALSERGIPTRAMSQPPPRASRYSALNDPVWLAEQLAERVPLKAIARQIGCDRQTVRKALRRHGLS
jgi:hypothetical protein